MFRYPDGNIILAPSSVTSASSGPAYLLPTDLFGLTGVPAAERAATSAASASEFLDIFHAEALNPVDTPP